MIYYKWMAIRAFLHAKHRPVYGKPLWEIMRGNPMPAFNADLLKLDKLGLNK